jgi:hypothetical protein
MGDSPPPEIGDMRGMHRILLLAAVVVAFAGFTAPADAAGGHYVFSGGTAAQQTTVTKALEASSFNWNLVPATITIRIARNLETEAVPGEIRLDADLLDSREFAWGVVQHEYAHQVDFFLLTDDARSQLLPRLGGASWWSVPGAATAHHNLGSERFASTLTWAFWMSPANALKPTGRNDEAAAMAPAAFRALARTTLGPAVAIAAVSAPRVVAKAPRSTRAPSRR